MDPIDWMFLCGALVSTVLAIVLIIMALVERRQSKRQLAQLYRDLAEFEQEEQL